MFLKRKGHQYLSEEAANQMGEILPAMYLGVFIQDMQRTQKTKHQENNNPI